MATLKKIFFYVLLLLALSWIIEYVIFSGIKKNRYGLYNKLTRIFEQENEYNLLIIGSSRAECHFDPKIIDSITGLNSYNIGFSGSNNAFTYGMYKTYLSKSKAPRYAIMNIDFHFAHESSDTIYEFPKYFPYLENEMLYKELKSRDSRFIFFKYLPLYKLAYMGDKYLNVSARGYFNKPGIYDVDCYKGFQVIHPVAYKNLEREDARRYKASVLKENIDYLDSIVNLSKKNGTEMFFVVSPTYYKGSKRIINLEQQLKTFEELAAQKGVPFIDYTAHPICYDATLFVDFYHMKKQGAKKFTLEFAEKLDSLLGQ